MVYTLEKTRTFEISRRRFTREEYHRLGELGFFRGERVELIEGDIVRMSPVSPLHGEVVTLIAETLWNLFGKGYRVRVQQPLAIGDSEPEPDIAVVAGKPGDYREAHPTTALLVVEVAQTSVEYDREVKAPLYARAGVPEYWIVNLDEGCIEVYRDPAPLGEGYAYRSRRLYTRGEQIAPLQKPEATVKVEELLLG
ncbi:MAG: Uma2 family endonuclease [bacterium]|nr:Uma2 family endonuclease [bacterium]